MKKLVSALTAMVVTTTPLYAQTCCLFELFKSNPNKVRNRVVNRGVDTSLTNTFMVVYDFKTGIYIRNYLKARVNFPIVYKIKNINRLAYQARITAKDSVLAGSFLFVDDLLSMENELTKATDNSTTGTDIASAVEKSTEIQTFGKNEIVDGQKSEKLLDALQKVSEATRISTELAQLKNQREELKRSIREDSALNSVDTEDISDSARKLRNTMAKRSIREDSALNSVDTEDISDSARKLRNTMATSITDLKTTAGKLDRLIKAKERRRDTIKINNKSLEKFNQDNERFISAFGELLQIYNSMMKSLEYYQKTLVVTENPELTLDMYKKMFRDSLRLILLRLPDAESDINKFGSKYVELEILYRYLKYNPRLEEILDFGGRIKLYTVPDNLKALADKMNEVFIKTDFKVILRYMKQAIPLLDEPTTFSVVSYPIQPKNDLVVFDIDIKKIRQNSSCLYREVKFQHSEFTYGGVRFDVGIGLAGTYFPNVPVYELEQTPDNHIQLVEKSDAYYTPSILILGTMSIRNTRYTAFGISAGLGLGLSDGEIQLGDFFMGPSVVFGKYDRVTITAGFSVSNVDILKSSYSPGENYSSPISLEDVLTKEYRFGFFGAITYNLTTGVKDNVKYVKSFL